MDEAPYPLLEYSYSVMHATGSYSPACRMGYTIHAGFVHFSETGYLQRQWQRIHPASFAVFPWQMFQVGVTH